MISYTMYAPNAKDKVSMTDFMPLLTDTPEVHEILTTDEQLRLQDLAQSRLALLNRK